MSDRIEYPIETRKEGRKITKICVEDIHRPLNHIIREMDRRYNNIVGIINSTEKKVPNANGEIGTGNLIVGTGISQAMLIDTYDEEIGQEIAFRKAKLNANIKKRNVITKIYNETVKFLNVLDEMYDRYSDYIDMDINAIKVYNPDYEVQA